MLQMETSGRSSMDNGLYLIRMNDLLFILQNVHLRAKPKLFLQYVAGVIVVVTD